MLKILLIHNAYGKYSGEEAVVDAQIALLQAHGHTVSTCFRSSEELQSLKFGKVRSFFTGLYNFTSIKDVKHILNEVKPDIVHIHNLYPLLSPSVLPVIRKMGVPIVMTVHNYRLLCPNGLFFTHNRVCEACVGKGKEWNCILRNCENSLPKSMGYALRNYWARIQKYFIKNVGAFICLTQFQQNKLISYGIPAAACVVIPNFARSISETPNKGKGSYVLFVGRLNAQKGFDFLLEAARDLPQVTFRAAGEGDKEYMQSLQIPDNVILEGKCDRDRITDLYKEASMLVFTSRSYEGFPTVFTEAMSFGVPVIAPNMAAYPEVVEHSKTGLLFEPGNLFSFESAIQQLIDKPEFAKQLSENAYKKLQSEYSSIVFYNRLMSLYNELCKSSSEVDL